MWPALRKVTDTDGFGLNSTSYGTPFRRSASASTSSAEYSGASVIDRRPRYGALRAPTACTCALSLSITGTRSAVGLVQ